MENTQVRFANISIKASDEFLQAVKEENKYDNNEFLVYKNNNKEIVMDASQDEESIHYSTNIPSKDISKYDLLCSFTSMADLNQWLSKEYNKEIIEDDFINAKKRDAFGDYTIELKDKKFNLSIKQAGDFLLYFNSEQTNEVRELIKASVDLDFERAEENPRVFTKIHMIYTIGGNDLPEKLVNRLIQQSHEKYCTISNMLKHTANISWELIME